MKIIYVPLDERPCNYRYPKLLSEITEDVNMLLPPFEYMGKLKTPANVNKLWSWVFENVKDCDYAILSIDTMIYGNIISSRTHHKTQAECEALLNNLRKIKELNKKINIQAFNLVARVANYDGDAEDPDYWKQYGTKIWKYSYYLDKKNRGIITAEETKDFENISKIVPNNILDDFLFRREVDRFVNLKCVDFVREGIIDNLVIPKDDTAEFGYAAIDQDAIAKKVYAEKLMDKVMVYPGADEVGSILYARVFNMIKSYSPKVYTRYSSTLGGTIIPRYEDRPLNEGIKAQITSMGGICVDTPQESDFMFAVNAPGKTMIECGSQFGPDKDLTYHSYANPHEFIRYINYYIDTYKKPVALSDVVFSNGADNEFMAYANKVGLLERISAYGGWNTSENTNGMCLAHANLVSYYQTYGWPKGKEQLSTEFLLRKIVEDWLFQANMLYQTVTHKDEFPGIDFYHVIPFQGKLLPLMESILADNIKNEMGTKFHGKTIEFGELTLPWDRIFDVDFEIKLV